MNITKDSARATLKSINRHLRKNYSPEGREYGSDYATFAVLHPEICKMTQICAFAVTGNTGRFVPVGYLGA